MCIGISEHVAGTDKSRTQIAKLLEKGDINALFLADTYGGYDTYENSLDECIRRAAQWPMTDPTIVSHSPDSLLNAPSRVDIPDSPSLPWQL